MWSRGPRIGRPPRGPRGIAGRGGRRERQVRVERAKPRGERPVFWVNLKRRVRAVLRWFVLRPLRMWAMAGPFKAWFPRPPVAKKAEGQTGVMKQFPKERSWQ